MLGASWALLFGCVDIGGLSGSVTPTSDASEADPPESSTDRANVPVEAGAPLCSGSDLLYCQDFDDGGFADGEVTIYEIDGLVSVQNGTAVSPPNAVQCEPMGDAGAQRAAFIHALDGAPRQFSLAFDMKLTGAPDIVTFAYIQHGNDAAERAITLSVDGASSLLSIADRGGGVTNKHGPGYATTIADGQWHHFLLEVALTPSPSETLTVDGLIVERVPLPADLWKPDTFKLWLCGEYFANGTMKIFMDNIVARGTL